MFNNLQKAISISKKTGDRVIFFDSRRPDDAFVVMDLESYDKILNGTVNLKNLTEDQMIDKINRDIAIWKNQNASENFEPQDDQSGKKFFSFKNDSLLEPEDDENIDDEDEDTYYYENSNEDAMNIHNDIIKEKENSIQDKKSHWSIPKQVKEIAEDVQ